MRRYKHGYPQWIRRRFARFIRQTRRAAPGLKGDDFWNEVIRRIRTLNPTPH